MRVSREEVTHDSPHGYVVIRGEETKPGSRRRVMRRHWGQGRGEGRLVNSWVEPDSRGIPPTSEVSRKTTKLKPLELVVKVRWYHQSGHLVSAGQVLLHLQQALLLIHQQLGVVISQLGII